MQLSNQQKEAQERENSIIVKCWEDDTFKQQLIANPAETIKTFTGHPVKLPSGVQLVINDQADSGFAYFNIPAKPNMDDVELNEEDLEAVAGGLAFGHAFTIWRRAHGYTIFGY